MVPEAILRQGELSNVEEARSVRAACPSGGKRALKGSQSPGRRGRVGCHNSSGEAFLVQGFDKSRALTVIVCGTAGELQWWVQQPSLSAHPL